MEAKQGGSQHCLEANDRDASAAYLAEIRPGRLWKSCRVTLCLPESSVTIPNGVIDRDAFQETLLSCNYFLRQKKMALAES